MTRVYYNGAHGAVIMYDLNNPDTFAATDKWKEDLENKVRFNDQVIPALLIGNKSDLLDEQALKKAEEDLQQKVKDQKYAGGITTSAKNGTNGEEAMAQITRLIFKQFTDLVNPKKDDVVDISNNNENGQEKGGCCSLL